MSDPPPPKRKCRRPEVKKFNPHTGVELRPFAWTFPIQHPKTFFEFAELEPYNFPIQQCGDTFLQPRVMHLAHTQQVGLSLVHLNGPDPYGTLGLTVERGEQRLDLHDRVTRLTSAKWFCLNYIVQQLGPLEDDQILTLTFRFRHVKPRTPGLFMLQPAECAQLGDALYRMMTQQFETDVILLTQTTPLHAHALVLSGRSEVFRTMMASSFKEAMERTIDLSSWPREVVLTVINHCYDQPPSDLSIADYGTLLRFCHQYQFTQLLEQVIHRFQNTFHLWDENTLLDMYELCQQLQDDQPTLQTLCASMQPLLHHRLNQAETPRDVKQRLLQVLYHDVL